MNGDPTFPAGDWDNEDDCEPKSRDFDNGIPGAEWKEYDAAADWCAERGFTGAAGTPLPVNLSARAFELIEYDHDAFGRRVREHAYFRAMTGPRMVRIIKNGEA